MLFRQSLSTEAGLVSAFAIRVKNKKTLTRRPAGGGGAFETGPGDYNSVLSEVKTIQQLEGKRRMCPPPTTTTTITTTAEGKGEAASHLPGEATTSILLPASSERHASHLDKLGHEVGPQCGEYPREGGREGGGYV